MLEQNVFPGCPRSHINIKRPSYQFGNSDYEDKTVSNDSFIITIWIPILERRRLNIKSAALWFIWRWHLELSLIFIYNMRSITCLKCSVIVNTNPPHGSLVTNTPTNGWLLILSLALFTTCLPIERTEYIDRAYNTKYVQSTLIYTIQFINRIITHEWLWVRCCKMWRLQRTWRIWFVHD